MKVIRNHLVDYVAQVKGYVAIEHWPETWTVYEIEIPGRCSYARLVGLIYRYHKGTLKPDETVSIVPWSKAMEVFHDYSDQIWLHTRSYQHELDDLVVTPEMVLNG